MAYGAFAPLRRGGGVHKRPSRMRRRTKQGADRHQGQLARRQRHGPHACVLGKALRGCANTGKLPSRQRLERRLALYVGALLRCAAMPKTVPAIQGPQLDEAGQRVLQAGQALPLTRLEYRLLRELLLARGRILRREALLHSVWGTTAKPPTARWTRTSKPCAPNCATPALRWTLSSARCCHWRCPSCWPTR